ELGTMPRTVLDSGLLHSLDGSGQAAYVAGLAAICPPGALVVVLAISLEAGQGWGETETTLRARFGAPDWVGTAVEDIEVHARWPAEHLPGVNRAAVGGDPGRARIWSPTSLDETATLVALDGEEGERSDEAIPGSAFGAGRFRGCDPGSLGWLCAAQSGQRQRRAHDPAR